MKPFLALIGGLVGSLGLFAGGGLLATLMLAAEPVETQVRLTGAAAPWTVEPVAVDADQQDYERLPAVARPSDKPAAGRPKTAPDREAGAEIDPVTTASLQTGEAGLAREHGDDERREDSGIDQELLAAHLDWCHDRYRSYRESDNSYRPYSGGTRPCVSPYLEEMRVSAGEALARLAGETGAGPDGGPVMGYAAEDGGAAGAPDDYGEEGDTAYYADEAPRAGGLGAAHVRDCFSRYRSYRVSDNTYQPYGGGPRRQCR
ncbi:MAG: BA14K family protein [Rhizobiaceae bacterium]|nr:BA14K family protein [Rhizobiaceae bacterium]